MLSIFFAQCLGAILEYEIRGRLGRVQNEANGVGVKNEGRGRERRRKKNKAFSPLHPAPTFAPLPAPFELSFRVILNVKLEEDWGKYKMGPTGWVSETKEGEKGGRKIQRFLLLHPASTYTPLRAPFASIKLSVFCLVRILRHYACLTGKLERAL